MVTSERGGHCKRPIYELIIKVLFSALIQLNAMQGKVESMRSINGDEGRITVYRTQNSQLFIRTNTDRNESKQKKAKQIRT
jgi:hypothetical protein